MCINKLFKLPKNNLIATTIMLGAIALAFFIITSWSHKQIAMHKKQITIIQNVEHPALNATRLGLIDVLQAHKDIKITFQSAQGVIVKFCVQHN